MSRIVQIDPNVIATDARVARMPLRLMLIAAAMVAIIAVCDFATFNINFAIIYLLPLLLVSQLHRPRMVWQWAIALAILAYAGYFAGVHGSEIKQWSDLIGYRLVNRSLEVGTLLSVAALLHIEISLRELTDRRAKLARPGDVDEHVFDQIIASFDRFATTILCILMIGLVTLTDVLTPPQFNIAILFCLPLVASARMHKRAIVWLTLPLLIVLAIAGLYLGPRPLPVHIKDILVLNRLIACLVLIGVAIILHVWIGRRATSS
ncbi:MAG TPA: hypothetical protein VL282_02970 [Tepidisphaeraceae bacterium]|nr:hypothetical protein [Tepidisphaeraceae bacterium]